MLASRAGGGRSGRQGRLEAAGANVGRARADGARGPAEALAADRGQPRGGRRGQPPPRSSTASCPLRRSSAASRLTPEESARTERLARIVALAERIWNDDDETRAFLNRSHPLLDDRTPLDVGLDGARRAARRATSPQCRARPPPLKRSTRSASGRCAIRCSTAEAPLPATTRAGTRGAGASSTRQSTMPPPWSRRWPRSNAQRLPSTLVYTRIELPGAMAIERIEPSRSRRLGRGR